MRLKVIFDKASDDKRLHTGWGVSFLIDNRVLFDTGENGPWLMENLEVLGVPVDSIEAVVISHDHWDHHGGLWDLLKKRSGLTVYACPNFSNGFKEKVVRNKGTLREMKDPTEISKGIFVSGEIAGEYKGAYMGEQALVAQTGNGISIITGCAHPGIVTMVRQIKEAFGGHTVHAVLGGFHLMDKDQRMIRIIADEFNKMGVEKAGPTHCSGKTAEDIFKEAYGYDFIEVKTGQDIDI